MSQDVKADCEKHQHSVSCDCSVENYDADVISLARKTFRPHSKLWRNILDSCVVMNKEFSNIFDCEWDKIPAQYLDLAKDLDFVLGSPDVGHDLERFRCLRQFRSDIYQLPKSISNRSNLSETGTYELSECFFQKFRGGHDEVLLDTLDSYHRLSQQCLDDRMEGDDEMEGDDGMESDDGMEGDGGMEVESQEASQANAESSQTNAESNQTNAESNQNSEGPWPYYSPTVPFVQSSCTGKTRTAYEVVRKRFGFNICLREDIEEVAVYPPPDDQVRDYFTDIEHDSNLARVVIRYRLFLIELFRHTISTLDSDVFSQYQRKYNTLSEAWSSWFETGYELDIGYHGENHRQFYDEVTNKAKSRLKQKDLTSKGVETECKTAGKELINKLRKDYDDKKRHTYIGEDQSRVEFVIFFDEAHSLSQLTVKNSKGKRRTGLLTMERALKCLLDCPIFAVFMSTNSQLEGLATPSIHHPSYRDGSHRFQLFPPLSEFVGFDLFAAKVGRELFASGITLEKLLDPKLMVSFGRPHWYGVWDAFEKDATARKRVGKILNIAREKLNPDPHPERDINAPIAWIGNRLCLEPDIRRAEGRAFQSKLIESYMGVVVSIPEHRLYMLTTTPSEPVLVEASAQLMAEHKVNLFKLLRTNLGQGLLAKGERGEIVTRALMVLAHDKAARDEKMKNGFRYCRPIPLLAFLRALLTESAYETMMEATPVLKEGDQKKFRDAFKDTWINVSHFVRAGDFEVVQIQHLRNFFFRGAAVQCHPTQEAIDCVAPLLRAPTLTTPISYKETGDLKVQTKNRDVTTPLVVTTHQTRPELAWDDEPTISIVIEYGDKKQINQSNCIEVTHTTMRNTRSNPFRPQTMNYQVTLRGLEAFRLTDEQKIDIRVLLDLTSTLEAFPRASHANLNLMRRLKHNFKAKDGFSSWASNSSWKDLRQ
ncbi:hypothetical protein GGX14DRAFT_605162 [Mycena pura]|uniref:Uncharacterized protein n=1 Tax=Mycena pura TaxID=153505 RepID=A0AAD6YEB1_9AGAR|nr:hypothetical protein GGX14DRAFT_605162 [Mycena pura]